MHRFGAFERMRSLDECQVAVRSRKVDFLSGNERYSVVELMRVTVCMSQLLRAVSLRHFVLNLQLGAYL